MRGSVCGERNDPTDPGMRAMEEMDPIHKPMMNPNFGVPLIKVKRPVISCNVCQIRFNSESQAEAHYKGNRHARRVKGIENAKTRQKEGTQDGDRNTPLISPVPSASESDTDSKDHQGSESTDMCSSESPETMITNETTVAVVSGCPESTSEGIGEEAKPLSFTDPASSGTSTSTTESDDDRAKKLLYCALCKVSVNSLSQLEAHNKGTKHKTILEARSGLGPIKAYPRLGGLNSGLTGTVDSNNQERTFHCEICNVRVTSEGQLKQHISSRRHRDGVSGKPNPLLSRHKKQQTLQELTASLVFQKDLPKTLSAGLLPSPLAVAMAAAAAVSSPLSLRPAGTPSLLQGPPLTHHMLRPAPGPIRTAHGTILFSPY